MKNNVLVTFIAFLSYLTMNAQFEKGDIALSPQLGVNFSTYVSEAAYNSRTAVSIGANVDFYLSDSWSIKTGLMFYGMGAEDGFGNLDKLNYVTVPFNANWHFGKKRNWYMNFGPAVSFLAGAEAELSDGSKFDIKEDISSVDVGLALGIGYTFNVDENLQLFIDYQGYAGFINVDKNDVLPYNVQNSRNGFNVGAIIKL